MYINTLDLDDSRLLGQILAVYNTYTRICLVRRQNSSRLDWPRMVTSKYSLYIRVRAWIATRRVKVICSQCLSSHII